MGNISDASSSLTVRGAGNRDSNIGGLVGWLQSGWHQLKTPILVALFQGLVNAKNGGGLVGYTAKDTTIDNSWASGNVSSTGNSC